jgi:hypothetical protein
MELNEFDKALRKFMINYAEDSPETDSIVECGDIVTTKCIGWKQPHKVKIYEIGVEIVDLNLTIGEREKLGIDGWIGVGYYYFANRINSKGETIGTQGMALTNFVTDNGKVWQKVGRSFNHCGLCFVIERMEN